MCIKDCSTSLTDILVKKHGVHCLWPGLGENALRLHCQNQVGSVKKVQVSTGTGSNFPMVTALVWGIWYLGVHSRLLPALCVLISCLSSHTQTLHDHLSCSNFRKFIYSWEVCPSISRDVKGQLAGVISFLPPCGRWGWV